MASTANQISAGYVARMLVLCGAAFLLWYVMMLMMSWYDPKLHIVATASSIWLVGTGRSWGIIEKLVR